jgi:hypothetical protein
MAPEERRFIFTSDVAPTAAGVEAGAAGAAGALKAEAVIHPDVARQASP